jgi:tRNA A-37 threonylcarbamoyl transferase component Bud32
MHHTSDCKISQHQLSSVLKYLKNLTKKSKHDLFKKFSKNNHSNWICRALEAVISLFIRRITKRFKLSLVGLLSASHSSLVFSVKGEDLRMYNLELLIDPIVLPPTSKETRFLVETNTRRARVVCVLSEERWCGINHAEKKDTLLKLSKITGKDLRLSKTSKKEMKKNYNQVCRKLPSLIPDDCLRKGGWEVTKVLGSGAYGVTFEVRRQKKGVYDTAALKVTQGTEDSTGFTKEVNLQKAFASLGLAPRIICVSSSNHRGRYKHTSQSAKRTVDTYNFYSDSDSESDLYSESRHGKTKAKITTYAILMHKIDCVLEDYLTRPDSEFGANTFLRSMFVMLEKMRNHNIIHGDFHGQNIALVMNKEGFYYLQTIDFGFSSDGFSDVRYDIVIFLHYLHHLFLSSKKEFVGFDPVERYEKLRRGLNSYLETINEKKISKNLEQEIKSKSFKKTNRALFQNSNQ